MWKTRIIRLLPALLGAWLLAAAAQAAPAPGQALLGKWQEYEPATSVGEFLPDHTLRLYLTREEGGAQNLHWIDGTWSLTDDHTLTMTLTAFGRSLTDRVKVSFEHGELWLVDEREATTRHRRLSGELPKIYRW